MKTKWYSEIQNGIVCPFRKDYCGEDIIVGSNDRCDDCGDCGYFLNGNEYATYCCNPDNLKDE